MEQQLHISKQSGKTSLFSVRLYYENLSKYNLTQSDFEFLAVIGRGAFGEVRVVRMKSSGTYRLTSDHAVHFAPR